MRSTKLAVFLFVLPFGLGLQCRAQPDPPDQEVVNVTRDDFLRLAISDALREATGLWKDQLHWRVVILDSKALSSAAWKQMPSAPGRKTVVVFLDHPNGADIERYRATFPMLEETAKAAVNGVLEEHKWQDRYLAHAAYIGAARF